MTSMQNSHRCLWFDMICLIKYGLSIINVYYFKHGIILNCGFSTKVTCMRISGAENPEEIIRLKF